MAKRKNKGIIILASVIGVILVAMIAIPVLFKGKIKDIVVRVANDMLKAELYIGDLGLNLFSNFPKATISLKDTYLVGEEEFSADTLLQAKAASVTIDLFSLFGDSYDISTIILDRVSVYAKVLPDGKANWDIMESSESESSGESNPFNLSLKKISINDCNIVYEDGQSNMKAIITRWNGNISGDFSASETTLKTKSVIDELSFIMDGIPYMSKVKASVDASIKADLDKMAFTFEDSELALNALVASIDGSFGMPSDGVMDFDLTLNAPDTQFKEILSLVPAMYTDDFKNVKTSGTASLDGYLKGRMEGDNFPAFDFKLNVGNAMFQYPSLPKSVDQINVDIVASSKGGSLDNTIVDISKFSFSLGGNPFNGSLKVTTPMSDPNLNAKAHGTLDLGMIKEVYPLDEGMELNGRLVADMSIAAAMSAVEKEQYDRVSAAGSLKLSNMLFKSPDMPDVKINDAGLNFSPQYVSLTSLNVNVGDNDIAATGRLENFIGFALKSQTLKGNLDVKSNYFNANDFLSGEEAVEAEEDTISLKDIVIPKNIDFRLNADFKKILYDKLTITNLAGAMTVKDGILTLNNVGANALGGTATISGAYDTSTPDQPKVGFKMNLQQVSFAETFKSVEAIQKFAPIFESLIGTFSMNFDFNTLMGNDILQTLAALTGSGTLITRDVKVENNSALSALSSALKTDALQSFSASDLNLPFTINNGQITAKPFSLNMGNGGKLQLEGTAGLDQSINYKGSITLPKALTNSVINNVPITIGGTFTSPSIGIDAKAIASDAITSVVSSLVNSGKADGEQVDLSEEKAKQIEKLRTEADETAKKLVTEAEKAAKDLEDKASNALTKAAARTAGKKLVEEAEKQGQNLRDKAEEQIKKLEGE